MQKIFQRAFTVFACLSVLGSPPSCAQEKPEPKEFPFFALFNCTGQDPQITIEERVNLLEGTMSIQSRPSKGTKILIEVPYREKKDG